MKYVIFNNTNGRLLGISDQKFRTNEHSPPNAEVAEFADFELEGVSIWTHKYDLVEDDLVELTQQEKEALYRFRQNKIKSSLIDDIEQYSESKIGQQATDGFTISQRMRNEVNELVSQHLIKQVNPAYTLPAAAELPRKIDKDDGSAFEISTTAQLYNIHGKMVHLTHAVRNESTNYKDQVKNAATSAVLKTLISQMVSDDVINQDIADIYLVQLP
jgi:hypothetical protein